MEHVVTVIGVLAMVAILTSAVYVWRLTLVALPRDPGLGKTAMLAWCAHLTWDVMVIGFFLYNTLVPYWDVGIPDARPVIRGFFGVYLLVYGTLVSIYARRYIKERE